jgi:hypothetical protein
MVIRHVFDQTLVVAGQASGLFELASSVVRLELPHLRAQLSLPLTALVVLHASHAQTPHHRLCEGLRGEGGARERLAADRAVSRSASVLRQTLAANGVT